MRRPYLLALLAVGCREPTYVSAHLTTDVPCDRLQGVTITVGTLGALEDKIPATRTATCNDGEIGTISLVPTSSDDDELGIRAVMGIGRDVESCAAPAYGDGCVVARRGLRYLPHQMLTLPIVLRQICNGIPCGPYETCIKGVCKSAKVEDPSKCTTPDGCNEDTFVEVVGDGGSNAANAEPTTGLTPFCGTSTAVDLAASWPMRGGCPTHANRTRFHGPATMPASAPKAFDVGAPWHALVMDGTRGWGVRQGDGIVTAQPIDLTSDTPQTSDGATVSNAGSCILIADGSVTCVGFRTVEDLARDAGGLNGALRNVPLADSGVSDFDFGWVVAANRDVLALQRASGGGDDLVAIPVAAGAPLRFRTGVTGTTSSWPALSLDGTTLYVATDSAVSAFDATSGAKKWEKAMTTAAVAVGPSKNVFVVGAVPGGSGFNYVVRTFDPDGNAPAADIVTGTGTTAPTGELGWDIAVGYTDATNTAEELVVLRPGVLVALDVQRGKTLWLHQAATLPRMIWSLGSNRVYLAGDGAVTAIDAATGADVWTQTSGAGTKPAWNAAFDMATGGDNAIYVATDAGIHRFGP